MTEAAIVVVGDKSSGQLHFTSQVTGLELDRGANTLGRCQSASSDPRNRYGL